MKIRTLIRTIWIVYALALFTATHWPGLTLPPGPVSRMDLVVHASVFGLWTLLFYLCGWIAPKHCPIRRIVWTGVIAIVFSSFDELTQPIFSRTADPLDLAANMTGVIAMCILIYAARSMMTKPSKARSEGS